jgi:hypothetical protein
MTRSLDVSGKPPQAPVVLAQAQGVGMPLGGFILLGA